MDDLISRQAVKDWLLKWKGYLDEDMIARMQCRVIDIQSAQKWIPCSERPPEEGEEVLCQCVADIKMVLKYTNNGWYQDVNHTYMRGFVVAWMPLPPAEPEIIRCKDCDNWQRGENLGERGSCAEWSDPEDGMTRFTDQYDFCSYAERRTDETD